MCEQKRGPQRSVDVIVSAAFIIALLLLSFLTVELLKVSHAKLSNFFLLPFNFGIQRNCEGPGGLTQELNIVS